MEKECGRYHPSTKSVMACEKSANLVCGQKALQNTSMLHSNSCKNVTENSCAYMDDVELEWLGEGDVVIHCTPQIVLVTGTPIISLNSTMNPWEDVQCVCVCVCAHACVHRARVCVGTYM